MPDQQIARLLNRAGKPTGRGNGWTKAWVCSFRSHYGIAIYRESEWGERGEITCNSLHLIGHSLLVSETEPSAGRRSHVTQEQKIIRAKLGLLELAKQLGNVSQACKMIVETFRPGCEPRLWPTRSLGFDSS